MKDFYDFSLNFLFAFPMFILVVVIVVKTIQYKPLVFHGKWSFSALSLIAFPFFSHILHTRSFEWEDVIGFLVIVFILYLLWIQMQGYMVYSVTKKSLREAVLHALERLGIGYEETLGSLKFSSGDGEIYIQGTRSPMMIRGKNIHDKTLLKKIATEVNLYLQNTPVEMTL